MTSVKNGVSGILKKFKPEPKVKEPKISRREKRERFRKRLESLTPEEQKYLKRKRAFDTVWPIFRGLIVFGLCFVILYPLIFMVSAAFRPRAEMNDPTILWIPKTFTLSNIKDAIKAMDFWHTLGNTLVLNIGCSLVQVVTCALTGYGFARFKFKGKNILFFVVIMMILVPSQIILIPQYMFFRYFNPFGIYHAITGNYINLINTAVDINNVGFLKMPGGPARRVTLIGAEISGIKAGSTEEQKAAAMKWFEFFGISPNLTDEAKVNMEENYKISHDKNDLIGINDLMLWNEKSDTAAFTEEMVTKYTTINPNHVKSFNDKTGIEYSVEEPVCTQNLYKLIDDCLQKVLTEKDVDCREVVRSASETFQRNFLDLEK